MKKARIWHLIVLIAVVALILGVAPQSGTAQRIAGPGIEWAKDIKIEPAEKLTSHRLINKPVERGSFFDTANKVLQKITEKQLKIKDDHIGWSGDFLAWIDKDNPSSLIMQDAVNGNLSFSNRKTDFISRANPKLPSSGQAQEIALGFLKDLEFLPADFVKNSELLHVGGMFSQDFQDGRATEISQKLITLHYGRKLAGIPVEGPGSKLVLEIGHGGEIVSMNKKWNPIMLKLEVMQPLKPELRLLDPNKFETNPDEKTTPWIPSIIKREKSTRDSIKLSPTFTPDEVRGMINRTLPTIWTTAEKIVVNDVNLVYYDRSGDFIQPAYAVEMTVHTGEETFQDLYYFAALRNPPESVYLQVYAEMPKVMDQQQKPAEFIEEMD